MKHKLKLLLCLLLCGLLLCACAPVQTPIVETTLVPRVDTALPDVDEPSGLSSRSTATLYYRYLTEPYLASETRTVTQLPGQSWEMALLTELAAGPGTRSVDLTGLFPTGTHVLSTVRQGRTLFVTLSGEIMNLYADEPIDWQEYDSWRIESPLRRRLCMQSIVATATENCDVDQVQILVQQTGVTGSLRMKQNYFLDDSEDDVLVGPMLRDANALLTPDKTLAVILACWQMQNWERMYRYVSSRDPYTGADRLQYRDFVSTMERLPRVTDFVCSSGSVTADGSAATYTVNAALLREGGLADAPTGRVLRLCRENGVWKISLSQLTGWLEE